MVAESFFFLYASCTSLSFAIVQMVIYVVWDTFMELSTYYFYFRSKILHRWIIYIYHLNCIVLWVQWNLKFRLTYYVYDNLLKGNRFAMPLSRVALESPAGAARGQVWLHVRMLTTIVLHTSCSLFFYLPCDHEILEIFLDRLMTFVMKQMSFFESEITFSMSCLRKQVNLLRRLVGKS